MTDYPPKKRAMLGYAIERYWHARLFVVFDLKTSVRREEAIIN